MRPEVLGKIAAGVGLMAFLPVFFIAAAAGSLDAKGATTAGGVVCAPRTRSGSPLSAVPPDRAMDNAQASPRPCQAGELEAMVLSNPRIGLRPEARGDVAAALIDPRVLQVLLLLAERHDLNSVGPLITGHSYYVRGTTTPSNHAFGRAVDISVIDRMPVSLANSAALDAMEMILSLPPPLLPDELGGPWLLYHPPVRIFTRDHGDHIHVGWDG
jgi:hypothetical protein